MVLNSQKKMNQSRSFSLWFVVVCQMCGWPAWGKGYDPVRRSRSGFTKGATSKFPSVMPAFLKDNQAANVSSADMPPIGICVLICDITAYNCF